MKNILSVLFLSIFLLSNAQEKDFGTIQCSGKSEISIPPDIGIINLLFTSEFKEMSATVKDINKTTQNVIDKLIDLDFDEKDIKTRNFKVNKNYKYQSGKRIFLGYKASQSLYLEFKNSKSNISKILTSFTNVGENFQLSFSFKLSDDLREKTESELLANCVANAMEKAKRMASAANVELGSIKSIVVNENNYRPVYNNYQARSASMAMDSQSEKVEGFNTENLKISKRANLVIKIKQN